MNQQRTIVKLSRLPRFCVQRTEIHQVQFFDRIDHKMQRSLKWSQMPHINKTIHKVQQITEVSQQQYMNVDVSAEMQCQTTATHRHCSKLIKHNRCHSLNGVIRTS